MTLRKLLLPALVAIFVAGAAVAAYAAPTRNAKVGDYFLHPTTLTVSKGTKVTWAWVGSVGHNVSAYKGPVKFHSKTQDHGTYSHVFTRQGTYQLKCTIHPFMKGKVVVN